MIYRGKNNQHNLLKNNPKWLRIIKSKLQRRTIKPVNFNNNFSNNKNYNKVFLNNTLLNSYNGFYNYLKISNSINNKTVSIQFTKNY